MNESDVRYCENCGTTGCVTRRMRSGKGTLYNLCESCAEAFEWGQLEPKAKVTLIEGWEGEENS